MLLLVVPLLSLPTAYAINDLASEPVILKLGDDNAIDYTIEKIKMFIPNARVITISDMNMLKAASSSSTQFVIFVGHGETRGLAVGRDFVSWNDVKAIIKDSPSMAYLLASCYSKSAEVDGKFTIGFDRKVDVDEAALWAVLMYCGMYQQSDKMPEVVSYFTTVLTDKVKHPERNFVASLDYASNSHYVKGFWWNKYDDSYLYPVKYTHPDVYNVYTQYGTEDDWGGFSGVDNFGFVHLTTSTLDSGNLFAAFQAFLAGVGTGALVLATLLSGGITIIIGALIAFVGFGEQWIIDNYVRSEADDGWMCMQNLNYGGCMPWYYVGGLDFKLGGLGWWTWGCYYSVATGFTWFMYPDFYGGTDLGIGGI